MSTGIDVTPSFSMEAERKKMIFIQNQYYANYFIVMVVKQLKVEDGRVEQALPRCCLVVGLETASRRSELK